MRIQRQDYDRTLSIDERTQSSTNTDRILQKSWVQILTIPYEVLIKMKMLISDTNYCKEIRGDDEVGKQELRQLLDVEEKVSSVYHNIQNANNVDY